MRPIIAWMPEASIGQRRQRRPAAAVKRPPFGGVPSSGACGRIASVHRNHRAHLQSAAYLALGAVAVLAGWAGPTGMPWWAALGLEPNDWWHLVTLTAMGVPWR